MYDWVVNKSHIRPASNFQYDTFGYELFLVKKKIQIFQL